MTIDWKTMKGDISRGIKEGAESVAKKAGEVSAEGQKKVKIFNLKRKIQDFMEDLGAAIYEAEKKNPGTISDEAAKDILKSIEEAHAEIKKLEEEE